MTAFDPHASVDPVDALMRLFKIDRAFAREVVHRLPRVIKRGVPLETAQRLSQVLERIGASVEIIVAERTATAPQPGAPQSSERQTLGGAQGLANALAAHTGDHAIVPQPVPTSAHATSSAIAASARSAQVEQPNPVHRQRASMQEQAAAQRAAHASARQPMMSLPDPGVQEASSPLRAVSSVADARVMRALKDQPQARPSVPQEQGESPFGRESLSENVRNYLRAPNPEANLRASLPMGSWTEPAAEESRVTPTRSNTQTSMAPVARQSLPENGYQSSERAHPSVGDGRLSDSGFTPLSQSSADLPSRQSSAGIPPGKPSVKEILAERRKLSQTGAGLERVSRVTEESGAPAPNRAEPLVLPTFNARGSSLGEEIDELESTTELRRKLSTITWLMLAFGSLLTLGLLPIAMLLMSNSRSRARVLRMRTLQASSVLVGPSQLPELYACVKQMAIRLELSPSPRLYVAERLPEKVQSFVVRNGLVMVLDAGLLASCVRRDAGYVIQFALAHEMAAFVLGQHKRFRAYLARTWRKLHKAELFSADALAAKLMGDRNDAPRALASLLCGPELVHLLDLGELDRQTTSQEQEVSAVASSMEDGSYVLPRIQQLRRPLPNK